MLKNKDLWLFISRVLIGILFVYAGWAKVSDMASTVGFFAKLGLPAFIAYLVGYLELIGGILLILGLWFDRAAIVLAIIMLFAVFFTFKGGFMAYQMPMVVLAGLLGLLAGGPGSYAFKLKR